MSRGWQKIKVKIIFHARVSYRFLRVTRQGTCDATLSAARIPQWSQMSGYCLETSGDLESQIFRIYPSLKPSRMSWCHTRCRWREPRIQRSERQTTKRVHGAFTAFLGIMGWQRMSKTCAVVSLLERVFSSKFPVSYFSHPILLIPALSDISMRSTHNDWRWSKESEYWKRFKLIWKAAISLFSSIILFLFICLLIFFSFNMRKLIWLYFPHLLKYKSFNSRMNETYHQKE